MLYKERNPFSKRIYQTDWEKMSAFHNFQVEGVETTGASVVFLLAVYTAGKETQMPIYGTVSRDNYRANFPTNAANPLRTNSSLK